MEPKCLPIFMELSIPLVVFASLMGHEDERHRLAGCAALIGFAMGCAEEIFDVKLCVPGLEEDL